MTPSEKLRHDIDALRAAIRRDWLELANAAATPAELQAIGEELARAIAELTDLRAHIEGQRKTGLA
jgi:hypothetical protein